MLISWKDKKEKWKLSMNMAIDLFILQPVYQYRSIKIDSYLKKNKKKNPALGQKN